MLASANGHDGVVKLLLEWKGPENEWVDPRANENYAIQWASMNGHDRVVEHLLKWKGPGNEWVDPRAKYNLAIQSASQYGHDGVVNHLLKWRGPGDERVRQSYVVKKKESTKQSKYVSPIRRFEPYMMTRNLSRCITMSLVRVHNFKEVYNKKTSLVKN